CWTTAKSCRGAARRRNLQQRWRELRLPHEPVAGRNATADRAARCRRSTSRLQGQQNEQNVPAHQRLLNRAAAVCEGVCRGRKRKALTRQTESACCDGPEWTGGRAAISDAYSKDFAPSMTGRAQRNRLRRIGTRS